MQPQHPTPPRPGPRPTPNAWHGPNEDAQHAPPRAYPALRVRGRAADRIAQSAASHCVLGAQAPALRHDRAVPSSRALFIVYWCASSGARRRHTRYKSRRGPARMIDPTRPGSSGARAEPSRLYAQADAALTGMPDPPPPPRVRPVRAHERRVRNTLWTPPPHPRAAHLSPASRAALLSTPPPIQCPRRTLNARNYGAVPHARQSHSGAPRSRRSNER
ncbi:hypothetical protein HYPSUDRAFT_208620 [Hypholoma sublateritium FD-334 SS-4]|uniref:Uncharacterized protein n=1 Tax=Hypholoma sublateritium (strain FD-334 SS-4) TaxID=945553 RepID=A0A0D2P1N6_HYPSF|nr:hypothetical protein HYPSUDRAFT_208620 [Hypholoma sublateritium FD-334 SS-4]